MAEKTTKEKIEYLSRQEQQNAAFAALKDALQLINLEKTKNITSTTYSKDNLRTYLKAPATESNQKNLRKLSDYLYTISHVYRRMINYKSEQITCKAWTAYPKISLSEDNDEEKIKQDYDKICTIINNMHMETQIQKMMLRAWKYDCAFGYIYGDPEKDGSFYIHPLNNDYCRIFSASYKQGVLGIAFDMSYFRTYPDDLEYFDKEFQKLYRQYESDNIKWKELPIEKTFCLKINMDNLDYPVPPYSALFEDIINLKDLATVQNVVDELDAYKLIYMKIPTISGSKEVDDFAVDLELSNQFYQKISDLIPDGVNLALSPLEMDTIDFKKNASAEDANVLNKSLSQLIESNGAIVLNSNRITNSESFKKAMMVECIDAMKPVNQINAWVNLYLSETFGIENWTVEYSDVSPYFIDDRLAKLKEAGSYGVPVKLEYASLLNVSPSKERGMSYLENMLGLGTTEWITPFVSSNTIANGMGDSETGGAPKKDDSNISADGVASRDKR